MNLRSFQLSDVHAVSAIWKMTASRQKEQETLKMLSKQLGCDRDLVLVAEMDGQVVGAIVGTMDGSCGYFYCLAVHPDYQGRGVGRRLAVVLEERLRSKGVKRIEVMVDEGTEKLKPFYEHLGYFSICSDAMEKGWVFQPAETQVG
jgi:predicted N-acetyltransferase YhbS